MWSSSAYQRACFLQLDAARRMRLDAERWIRPDVARSMTSGNLCLDDQHPNALNLDGSAQWLYPQCVACSLRQSWNVGRLKVHNEAIMPISSP